ncbi:hypothetical protein CW696_08745 [ANME-2 cluster archaeon]|nr:hypothetical protein [Methanosarcinales archaeon]RJS68392.1 MAG: hypothetical protein CW696_08745 [ANME-2 cluster archaeon]RLG20613.1 MAG: hypothetical protein DRN77_07485 [Methanosarcinales archaeon]
MLTVITFVNGQHIISIEQITSGGMLATISLIISLSMAEILVESKWWNSWASSTLNMHSATLLLVFSLIVAFKILMVL